MIFEADMSNYEVSKRLQIILTPAGKVPAYKVYEWSAVDEYGHRYRAYRTVGFDYILVGLFNGSPRHQKSSRYIRVPRLPDEEGWEMLLRNTPRHNTFQ